MKKTITIAAAAFALTGFSSAVSADDAADVAIFTGSSASAISVVAAPAAASLSIAASSDIVTVTDTPEFDLSQVPGSVAAGENAYNGAQFRIDDLASSRFAEGSISGFDRVPAYRGEAPAFREGTGLKALKTGRPEFGELSTELEGANQTSIRQRRSASVRFSL